MHGDRRRTDQQRGGSHDLVHRRRQDAAVDHAGAALEAGLDAHRRIDREPVGGTHLEVESLRRLGATTEAQRVVHPDRFARSRRFRGADQGVEVGGHHEVTFHVPLP